MATDGIDLKKAGLNLKQAVAGGGKKPRRSRKPKPRRDNLKGVPGSPGGVAIR